MSLCACTLLLGLGLSTNGQYVEVTDRYHDHRYSLLYEAKQYESERYSTASATYSYPLVKMYRSRLYLGVRMGIEDHPKSYYYNPQYLIVSPRVGISNRIPRTLLYVDFFVDMGKGFLTTRGDRVETKNAYKSEIVANIGLSYVIDTPSWYKVKKKRTRK